MFRVQQLLRHPDAAVREKAALRLVKLAHLGRHPAIHRRALDLLGQMLGCELIQAKTRDMVVALPRAPSDQASLGGLVADRLARVATR